MNITTYFCDLKRQNSCHSIHDSKAKKVLKHETANSVFFSFSAEVRSGNNYLSISRVNQAPFLLRNGSNKMTFWANKHPNFDIIQCKKFQGLKNCRVGRKWSVNLVEKNPLSIKWMQIIMMMKFRSFFNYCSSTNIRWFAEGLKLESWS